VELPQQLRSQFKNRERGEKLAMTSEINIKAILMGLATMFGFAALVGLGLTIAGLLVPLHSLPSEEKLTKDIALFSLIQSIIGRFSGGFVAGWIAKRNQVKNAFALAVVDLVLSRAITLFSESAPVLSVLVGIATGVLATLCGGYLSKLASLRMGS
jgi:hypothetical protein